MRRTLIATACILSLSAPARAGSRIKDITDLEGARSNQLYGFGLVIGLGGTGGTSLFTQQVGVDMMKRLCVNSKIVQQVQTDNVFRSRSISAVMVTAEIGPFSRIGSRLDVTVSVIDDASSLQGGTLLFTPLKGADGVVYSVAQGPLSVGGFTFGGAAASAQKNFVSVARIPGGGLVEHEARGEVLCRGRVHLLLKNADYSTSRSIAAVINEWAPGRALPLDAGTVEVDVPLEFRAHVVAFLSDLGNLEVLIDAPARVVINERTGTVVAGENVTVQLASGTANNGDTFSTPVVADSQTGAVTNINSANIRQTGTDAISHSGAYDVFQVLTSLRDALQNTRGLTDAQQTTAVSQTLSELDRVNQSVLNTVGQQSASLQNLQAIDQQIQNVQLQTQQQINNVQGADISQVVIGMQSEQNLLQATLYSSSRILNLSLLDFLK